MKRLLRPIVAVLAAAMLAAACGGGTDDQVADAGDAAEQARTTSGETVPANVAADGSPPDSLDEYLGQAANLVRNQGGGGGGGRGAGAAAGGLDDDALEQQRLVQQEIQACMLAQGFEYVPEEVGDGLRFFLAGERSTLSPEELAETQGFGISTRFDAILEGDVDLTETTSPNDEHLATLSEAAADAWQLALRGDPPQRNDQGQLIDPETGEVLQGRNGRNVGGCTAEAQTAVRGDIESLDGLSDLYVEVEERISADPRVAEIGREWTACMNEEGFDYQDEQEARADITTEFRPLLRSFFQGANNGDVDGADGDGAGANGAGGNGGGQGRGNRLQAIVGLSLTADQEADLQALQDRERAIAVASLSCQGDGGEELASIRLGYEAEFVDENRQALEAFAR